MEILYKEAITLLEELIRTPSFSKEEKDTADTIAAFFSTKGIAVNRLQHNIWVQNQFFDPSKPVILLNSHHDTVKPNSGYTKDPFSPIIEDGKLFGLGSNDAGGALVALLAAFLLFYAQKDLNYNLIFAATAEEEISGKNGIEILLPKLGEIDFGIVGEPTTMQMAIAEKGLLVIDGLVAGKAGHAARNEGENAIYNAIPVLEWFRDYQFEKISPVLGKVKMTVTIAEAGSQHNIVPDKFRFTVDIRTTEQYTHEEIIKTIRQNTDATIIPRSTRLRPSAIELTHPIVQSGLSLGRSTFGSPTTSDQALMPFPTLKIGPGDSARSHTADEYIYINEIKEGISIYAALLKNLL
jgi:acetylornithine deacetylase